MNCCKTPLWVWAVFAGIILVFVLYGVIGSKRSVNPDPSVNVNNSKGRN